MQLPITANGGRTFPADWHFRTSPVNHLGTKYIQGLYYFLGHSVSAAYSSHILLTVSLESSSR